MTKPIESIFNYDFIIAPSNLHRALLKVKNKVPFSHTKLLTREDLFSSLYFSVDDEALLYVMKEYAFSYQTAKNYVTNLTHLKRDESTDKLKTLFQIFDSIKHTKYFEKGLGNFYFKNKSALILNYGKQDLELISLLELSSLNYEFYEINSGRLSATLYRFSTVSEEVAYQLNQMANLIHSGVIPSDIILFSPPSDYYLDLKLWAKEFGLILDLDEVQTLSTYPRVLTLLNQFENAPDFSSFMETMNQADLSEEEVMFLNTLIKYPFEGISREDYIRLIRDKISTLKPKHNAYQAHIEVTDEIPLYTKDKHIFVLGFVKGTFPKVKLDNAFIFDFEKERLGLNTSRIENKVNFDNLMLLFSTENHFYFSYPNEIKSIKQIVSDLAAFLGINEEIAPLPTVYFSSTQLSHYYGSLMDKKEKYNFDDQNIPILNPIVGSTYATYDHHFTGVKHYSPTSFLSLSFSAIDTYYSCPFRYYLERVLKLGEFETTLPMTIGNLFHKMMEDNDKGEIDVTHFISAYLSDKQLPKRDILIIEGMRDVFVTALTLKQELEAQMDEHEKLAEIPVTVKLDKLTQVAGRIDRLYAYRDGGLVLVDYKTGVKAFKAKQIEYGKSLQLPIYSLLLKHDERYKDSYIIGLFLQKLKQEASIISDDENEKYAFYKKMFKFSGIVLDDAEALQKFDKSFIGGRSSYITNIAYSVKNASFYSQNIRYSEKAIEEITELTEQKIKEAAALIRNNEFPIRPLKIDDEDMCKFCPFNHVCYKEEKDYLVIKTSEEQEPEEEQEDEII